MRHKRGGRVARISSSRRLGWSFKSPWIRLLHGKRLLERLRSQKMTTAKFILSTQELAKSASCI